jgi:hypothetical protein
VVKGWFGRRLLVVHVTVVDVDPVGAQPAQAVVGGAHDPATSEAALVRVVAHEIAHLRGHHPTQRERQEVDIA